MPLGLTARLAAYLRVFRQAQKQAMSVLSSEEIGAFSGTGAGQVRRDLSALGIRGMRGLGYQSGAAAHDIEVLLRGSGRHPFAIVGYGRLGAAIAGSGIFESWACSLEAVFDRSPHVISARVNQQEVLPASAIASVCLERAVEIGVMAVPDEAAQEVASALVEGGVGIIFNYSGALVRIPPGVRLFAVTPVEELARALYLCARGE
jgi:redox-sensing transcriptional repressor